MEKIFRLKKVLAVALLSCFLVLSLGANGTEEGGSAEKQTLSFITWRGDDSEAYDQIIAAFEAQYPNIDVNVEYFKGGSTYDGIVSTRGIGGELDFYAAQPGGQLSDFVKSGFALDISDQPLVERMIPGAIAAGTIDGKTYGVAQATSTMCVFYNKALFAEYGLTPPTTWDEFLNICETFKSNGVTPMAAGFSQSYIAQNFYKMMTSHYMPEEAPLIWKKISDREMTLYDEPIPTVAKAMSELTQKGYFVDGVSGLDKHGAAALFAQGKVAMDVEGTWRAGTIAGTEGAPEFGIFSIPFMGDSSEMINVVHPNQTHLIFPQSKNIDAALKFYDFMMTPEMEAIYSSVTGQVPTVKGTPIESPVIQMISDYISSTRPVLGPNLGNPNNEVYSNLNATWTQIMVGVDVDTVFAEMQATIDGIER
ncbi:MAG: extracellular solute-binding protein [Spirochaetales bacterium]|nr:extracellular solute-binding protein [Spirochaetales bacterium]